MLELVVLECDVQYHSMKFDNFLVEKLHSLKSKRDRVNFRQEFSSTDLTTEIDQTAKLLTETREKQQLMSELVLQALQLSCSKPQSTGVDNANPQVANIIADLRQLHMTAREHLER